MSLSETFATGNEVISGPLPEPDSLYSLRAELSDPSIVQLGIAEAGQHSEVAPSQSLRIEETNAPPLPMPAAVASTLLGEPPESPALFLPPREEELSQESVQRPYLAVPSFGEVTGVEGRFGVGAVTEIVTDRTSGIETVYPQRIIPLTTDVNDLEIRVEDRARTALENSHSFRFIDHILTTLEAQGVGTWSPIGEITGVENSPTTGRQYYQATLNRGWARPAVNSYVEALREESPGEDISWMEVNAAIWNRYIDSNDDFDDLVQARRGLQTLYYNLYKDRELDPYFGDDRISRFTGLPENYVLPPEISLLNRDGGGPVWRGVYDQVGVGTGVTDSLQSRIEYIFPNGYPLGLNVETNPPELNNAFRDGGYELPAVSHDAPNQSIFIETLQDLDPDSQFNNEFWAEVMRNHSLFIEPVEEDLPGEVVDRIRESQGIHGNGGFAVRRVTVMPNTPQETSIVLTSIPPSLLQGNIPQEDLENVVGSRLVLAAFAKEMLLRVVSGENGPHRFGRNR